MTVLELARWRAALDTGPMEWYWPTFKSLVPEPGQRSAQSVRSGIRHQDVGGVGLPVTPLSAAEVWDSAAENLHGGGD